MKKFILAVPSLALLATAGAAPLFSDNFSVNSSGNYTEVRSLTDVVTTYAYDYSADLTSDNGPGFGPAAIPSAPGATDKLALKVVVNGTAGAAQTIAIYPNTTVPAGVDFSFSFDVFARVPGNVNGSFTGGTGSTHHYNGGIHHSGTKAINPRMAGTANLPADTDGYYFSAANEGGNGGTSTTNRDYTFLEGGTTRDLALPITWGSGALENNSWKDHLEAPFPTIYPSASYKYFATGGGAAGDKWTRCVISYVAATSRVNVTLDGQQVLSYVDPNATYTSGKVQIGASDMFNGSSTETNYFLFDNLSIETAASNVTDWNLY